MHFLVRFFPEIIIKTRPVRKRFIKILRRNIRNLLVRIDEGVQVRGDWDTLEVITSSDDAQLVVKVSELLANTPGIDQFMQVRKQPLPDMDGIVEAVLPFYAAQLPGRTFAVRCKRQGHHDFTSVDVERHLGAALLSRCQPTKVSLKHPEVTVRVEIRGNHLYVVEALRAGLGGYPLGSQDAVLSLISGGFDSAVSSFQCIRRGLLTHYLFFNLGGTEHELAVKELAVYLWMRFGASQRVKFVTVPFEAVVEQIMTCVDNAEKGVVLKRMMMRAADRVAAQLGVSALVTGESIAQVSSQTLPNLALIDRVTDCLVLRPLATSDKQEIIDQARRIGTEPFSRNVPEYCGVISVKPSTCARRDRVESEEARMDMSVLDAALAAADVQRIDRVVEGLGQRSLEPEILSQVPPGAVVIDIRHPEEQARSALSLPPEVPLLNLPFYRLRTEFAQLDAAQQYLLYCDKGIMSRLHAAHLLDVGFHNVGVYRPRARRAAE